MNHVIHEVESHRHLAREHRALAELGQCERRVGRPVGRERVEHVVCRLGVGATGIGPHRADHGLDAPHVHIRTETPCCRCESAVLGGHVGQQVEEIPTLAGRRPAEIGCADGVDDVDRPQYRDPVEQAVLRDNSRHTHTISVCVRYRNAYYDAVAAKSSSGRPDLAAMLAPLLREMVAAEEPVLEAHGLTMWGYIVLLALDRSSMRTQAALAAAIGADKTRIIRTLDDLQHDGYIERRPDPDDRRVRLLAITEAGRKVKDAAQEEIQRGEERWLGELSAEERRMFLRVLERLTRREWG